MAKSKKTTQEAKKGLRSDFTTKKVNYVNIRFNNDCTLNMVVDMNNLTIDGIITGDTTQYTVSGTIAEVQ